MFKEWVCLLMMGLHMPCYTSTINITVLKCQTGLRLVLYDQRNMFLTIFNHEVSTQNKILSITEQKMVKADVFIWNGSYEQHNV